MFISSSLSESRLNSKYISSYFYIKSKSTAYDNEESIKVAKFNTSGINYIRLTFGLFHKKMGFSIPEIIRRKRDGHQLTSEEIQFFIDSVVSGEIEDCQTGAMLMAILLKQMNLRETTDLTKAMTYSGNTLKFTKYGRDVLVDKHSTGGVGDKISLILAPALAVYGLKVPMVSGRGLGYTGGTLDKLESIPGFKVNLSYEEMSKCLDKAGCFICGATSSFVPADTILYRLRDITGTVESPSLILASIMSKKVAEGIGTLVLDVKYGKAATLSNEAEAIQFSEKLVKVGEGLEVKTRVVLSNMNVPLGRCVGNALEVVESIKCLRNEVENSVTDLVKILGGTILETKGLAKDLKEGKSMIQETLTNKTALKVFQKMLMLQGVSEKNAEELCCGNYSKVLPPAFNLTTVTSPKSGIVTDIDALKIGKACWYLGAGRQKAQSQIDYSVGVVLLKEVGDRVEENEPWVEIHHSSKKLELEVESLIYSSLTVETNPDSVPPCPPFKSILFN